MELSYLFLFMW